MATELIARLNFFFYIKSNLYSFEAYNKNFKWRITLNLDKDRAVPLILNTLGFTFFFVSSEIFSLIARVSHHESVFFFKLILKDPILDQYLDKELPFLNVKYLYKSLISIFFFVLLA